MESLIVKQNVSRRFRRVPAAKRPSPFLAFSLSGQKPGKRPSFFRRDAARGSVSPRTRSFASTLGAGPALRSGTAAFFRALFEMASAKARTGGERGSGRPDPSQGDKQRRLATLAVSLAAAAAALGLALATVKLGEGLFPVREADFALPEAGEDLDLLTLLEESTPAGDFQPDSGMVETALPLSLSISYHVLQKGETIDSVAKAYGRDRDSIISMNGIVNVKRVKSGTKLKIPNMNGVIHVVSAGESLGKIAARYRTDVTSLLDANDLESYSIRKGQSLFIPGGKLDKGTLRQALGDLFSWPVRGLITSSFGYRLDPFTQVRRFHQAIDILGSMGQRVNAAMEGRVVDTGYNATYGNYIILSHDGGFQTCYAHLSKIRVVEGQRVDRGQRIGDMGNTGYSTGTHLHFAVYRKGTAVNPRGYLPK